MSIASKKSDISSPPLFADSFLKKRERFTSSLAVAFPAVLVVVAAVVLVNAVVDDVVEVVEDVVEEDVMAEDVVEGVVGFAVGAVAVGVVFALKLIS